MKILHLRHISDFIINSARDLDLSAIASSTRRQHPTALVENDPIANTNTDPARKAIALTWLFHLVGDVHQPLHSAQIFTTDCPNRDWGGDMICVRPNEKRKPMDLHGFWDSVITTSPNPTRLRNKATALRNRPEFSRSQLTELGSAVFEAWAKESVEIAVKIVYRNGAIPGAPKGSAKDCATVSDAGILPAGYARTAGRIADRRITPAEYRLADLLKRFEAPASATARECASSLPGSPPKPCDSDNEHSDR